MSIEALRLSDIPDILEMQEWAYTESLREPAAIFEGIINHSDFCFKIVIDGQMAGYVLCYLSDQSRDDFEAGYKPASSDQTGLYIHDLCISPDFQGRGLAKILFDAAERGALEKDIPNIFGVAVQDSLPFWIKLGFAVQGPKTYREEPGFLVIKSLRI